MRLLGFKEFYYPTKDDYTEEKDTPRKAGLEGLQWNTDNNLRQIPPEGSHFLSLILTLLVDSAADKNQKDHVSNVKETKVTPNPAYHLSSSDNPGTPLVTALLKGNNYRTWSRSMRTTLRAKTKLGFIDDTIKKPALHDEDYYLWEKTDSMVMAWIINSTDPSLHGSISHASTAKDVWIDLEERFAQTNAPRIHQLWRTLCLMQKQSDVTVTEFYTQFKSILDELDELQPLPECSCGTSKLLIQREEDRRVHLFLGGFDSEEYAHVKATILNSEPMPSLRRVFNHIQREESRLAAEKEKEVKDLASKRKIGLGDLHDGVYVFKGSIQGHSFAAAQEKMDKLWHSRLGHPSTQALQHLSNFLNSALRAACPTVKSPTPSPTSGETPVKSTQAWFPPTHPYTRTSAGQNGKERNTSLFVPTPFSSVISLCQYQYVPLSRRRRYFHRFSFTVESLCKFFVEVESVCKFFWAEVGVRSERDCSGRRLVYRRRVRLVYGGKKQDGEAKKKKEKR
ncbi:hypothetical protein TSUD_393870 [Trifolium subterraneum]|uniref:Retrotransposon Copia-like N-terminal domain-containing protein n=1 Tax=Trifolium subterraneum TaxID=3900 RepID=A0A2Z6MPC3_TRISU|nr:hypothetical protein TSUD_393870 [Trifolium subterraneum]